MFINISSIQVTIREFDIYIYDLRINCLISQQLFDMFCVTATVGISSYSAMYKIKLRIINFQKYLNQVSTTTGWAKNRYKIIIFFFAGIVNDGRELKYRN